MSSRTERVAIWSFAGCVGAFVLLIIVSFIGGQLNADRRFDCMVSLKGINVSALELQMLCESF